MKMENNNSWGGARKGAGRKKIAPELKKKTIRKGKVVYFRILDDDYSLLERISKENSLTVNKYIQKMVLDKIKQGS